MEILIAYYSRKGGNYVGGSVKDLPVGNTEVAAGIIQKLTGGDTFKVEPVKPYPAGYDETTRVAQKEQRQNARPEITGRLDDMDEYDVIFLGYPNWWGTMPMPVFTFLEAYDFSGKTILPFCTHEGSGLGRSESDIKRLCPATKIAKGLAIQGVSVQKAESAISVWLQEAGVLKGVKK
jgi:flavodoxin